MLTQIISHTPIYVWAILALLVHRGVAALRDSEVNLARMCVMPVVMLGLALQDIVAKFGASDAALLTWGGAALATAALVHRFSTSQVAPASTAGSVIVRGSSLPLVLMMSVFFTKYFASVAVAMLPALRTDILFSSALCALFGVLNGYFIGRLTRNLVAGRSLATAPTAAAAAASQG